jgi:hypothetical protein
MPELYIVSSLPPISHGTRKKNELLSLPLLLATEEKTDKKKRLTMNWVYPDACNPKHVANS